MKQVKFFELDAENKLTAVEQMFSFKKSHNCPGGAVWENEEDLTADLEQGYSPDNHFSFYINEFDEVETKIG